MKTMQHTLPRCSEKCVLHRTSIGRAKRPPQHRKLSSRAGHICCVAAQAGNGKDPDANSNNHHMTDALDLSFESENRLILPPSTPVSALKTTGLRRAPLSGGVKTATARYDLPTPQVAVRNLVEQAQFAHLCTVMSNMHHRRSGYPFGTLVDFACDGSGYPLFCLSPLAIHARNIMEDPRASMVVQMPGWTGLANARVTIFGDLYPLPSELQDDAREIFLTKFSNRERWVTGNFVYVRMHRIVDIYFVGGFGTVQWIDPEEYVSCKPDAIVLNNAHRTLQVLNETFYSDLKRIFYLEQPADDAAFISIDASGADVRVRHGPDFNVERIKFDSKVQTLDDVIVAMRRLLSSSGVPSSA